MRIDAMTSEHRFPTFDTRTEAIIKIHETYGAADWMDVSSTVAVFKWFDWTGCRIGEDGVVSLWLEVGTIFRDRWVVWKILDGDPSRFTTEDFGEVRP